MVILPEAMPVRAMPEGAISQVMTPQAVMPLTSILLAPMSAAPPK